MLTSKKYDLIRQKDISNARALGYSFGLNPVQIVKRAFWQCDFKKAIINLKAARNYASKRWAVRSNFRNNAGQLISAQQDQYCREAFIEGYKKGYKLRKKD